MSRIFVGNLPMDIKKRELDDLFYKYGRIVDIEIKQPNRPPAFAFLRFEDRRDAEDAVHYRDGYEFAGEKLRVQFAKDDRVSGSSRPVTRRTDYGVRITGLPRSCSWQDLKDHMRKAGEVVFSDVLGRGEGIVEYRDRESMDKAVDELDDTEFKNAYDTAYIRVKYATSRKSRSRSRSRSRDRGTTQRRRSVSSSPSSSVSSSPKPVREDKRSPRRSPSISLPRDHKKD